MTTGEKIRDARKTAQLTQKALSELCGIAEPTIRRYEADKLHPKIQTLQKIADALGVSVTEFLGGELLSTVPTCELVEELEKRAGVETTIAEPYQDVQVKVNGPAIVLVVID